MDKQLLVIINHPDSTWLRVVSEALRPLGQVQVASVREAPERVAAYDYDLVIIDATAIDGDVAALVAHLHKEGPAVPIVVATTSPTWQRAREVFLAGATDYIRKSFDSEKTLTIAQEVIERSRSNQSLSVEPEEDDHVQGDDFASR